MTPTSDDPAKCGRHVLAVAPTGCGTGIHAVCACGALDLVAERSTAATLGEMLAQHLHGQMWPVPLQIRPSGPARTPTITPRGIGGGFPALRAPTVGGVADASTYG